MFVFADGSHLSPVANKIYRRQIWKLIGLGFEDAEIVLERKSDNWVSVMVWWAGKAGATLRPGTLFLFDGKDMKVPLEMFPFTSKVGTIDAPLAISLIAEAAARVNPRVQSLLDTSVSRTRPGH